MHGSADAGIALVETSRTIVRDNIIADGKWGARLTLGASDNQVSQARKSMHHKLQRCKDRSGSKGMDIGTVPLFLDGVVCLEMDLERELTSIRRYR